jgi:hypothetical protein
MSTARMLYLLCDYNYFHMTNCLLYFVMLLCFVNVGPNQPKRTRVRWKPGPPLWHAPIVAAIAVSYQHYHMIEEKKL